MSDRDQKFDSHFLQAVFKRVDAMLNMSTTDHPQSDGQTERVNQILEDIQREYIRIKKTNWEDYLPILKFAYKNAKHVLKRFSPFCGG